MNIDEYIQQSVEDLNAMHISVITNYEPTKINGLEARVAHINRTIGAVTLALDSYVVFDGNHAYVISCTATEETYEKYRPQFEEMVKTFSLDEDSA